MKSAGPWIDTPLLCSSTCLSLSSSRWHFPSPGKSAIFSTSREKRSRLAARRKRARESSVVNTQSVKQYAEFSRLSTWRLFQGWLNRLILTLFYDFLSLSVTHVLISVRSRNHEPICISRLFCRRSRLKMTRENFKVWKVLLNSNYRSFPLTFLHKFCCSFKFRFNLKHRELYNRVDKLNQF